MIFIILAAALVVFFLAACKAASEEDKLYFDFEKGLKDGTKEDLEHVQRGEGTK